MNNRSNDTTRYLCACAFLKPAAFRDRILKTLRDRHFARSPELGVDMRIVARVCRFAERRALAFNAAFAGLTIVALFAALTAAGDPDTLTLLAVLFVITAGVLFFFKTLRERFYFAALFRRDRFIPAEIAKRFDRSSDPELEQGLSTPDQNLIVYGDFVPFVGAGYDLGGWSLAISTTKTATSFQTPAPPRPFTTADLMTEMLLRVELLKIDNLSCRDAFFVNGSDIRQDGNILPHDDARPLQVLCAADAEKYQAICDPRVRHYSWIRIEDWGGQIAFSNFLQCSMRGNNLFVETRRFILPPVAAKYRSVDEIGPPTFTSVSALLIGSFLAGPFYAVYACFALFAATLSALRRGLGLDDKEVRKSIHENPMFNFGAKSSLRTQFCENQFSHYFQKLDSDFYLKALDREILDALVDFLAEHNIDTADLKDRQSTIMNSGIIVQGGNVNADTLAVGTEARAKKIFGGGRAKSDKAPQGAAA